MADRKVLYRSGGSFNELAPAADRVKAIGMLSGGLTVTLETVGGATAQLDDFAAQFNLSAGIDFAVNGTKLGGTSGDTVIGDVGGYVNFTPTTTTVRGCLDGIDTKLGILSQGIGIVTFTTGEAFTAGQIAKISANNTAMKALATSLANARVIGVAETPIVFPGSGDITTGDGALIADVQLVAGLTLAFADEIFLSPAVSGSGTNVEPTVAGQVIIKVGEIMDASTYNIATGRGAAMILQIEPPTLIA